MPRVSNQALAAQVHVSPATCLRRVKRLIEAGVIERRVAILSPERLGHGLTAIVEVTLDRQSAEALAAFEARAVAEDAVQQCHRVSPGPDFVLTVQVADMAGVPRPGAAALHRRRQRAQRQGLLQRPPRQVRDPDRLPRHDPHPGPLPRAGEGAVSA